MLETRIVREVEQLAALGPSWSRLWQRCPNATVFQSPEWLLAWWRAFCPGEIMSATVERDGRLLGLAPLYLESGTAGGSLLTLGISISDYVDVLIDPADAVPVAEALIDTLLRESCWELIEWSE